MIIFIPLLITTFHLAYTFLGYFYIYPEFNLYPYLVSRGLTPYMSLVDQHPPLLFFGPLHLGQLQLHHPTSLVILFASLIIATDFLVFRHLYRRSKDLAYATVATCLFATSFLLLDGRFLWIESFILICLICYVYFQSIRPDSLLPGIFLSLSIALKPQLLPLVLVLAFIPSFNIKKILPLAVFPLIQIAYLVQHQLLSPYLEILTFNASTYASLALQPPTASQLLRLSLSLLPLTLLVSPITPLLVILGSITALPRFELYHLLPLLVVWTVVSPRRPHLLLFSLTLPILLLVLLLRHGPWEYRNVFFTPPSSQLLEEINKSSTLFILGAGDSLYYHTFTLPPGNYYLPQLPWYYQNQKWVTMQLESLSLHPPQIVLVNPSASVDGRRTLDYTSPVWNWVNTHYQKVGSSDGIDVYRPKTYARSN